VPSGVKVSPLAGKSGYNERVSETTAMITRTMLRTQLLHLQADPALRTAIMLFTIARLVTAVVASGIVKLDTPQDWYDRPVYDIHNAVFTTQGPLRPWLEPWYRWDTGWYLLIAHEGYHADNGSIAFPPLYPLLIRALAPLTGGDYLIAALLISNLFCVAALVLLYRLVALEHGDQVARRSVIFLVSFPTAFYLVAGYTESLFLALAIGAILAARQRRYLLAGLLALLASLSRLQGWALAVPLAYIVYVEPGDLRRIARQPVTLARRLPAAAGGVLGTGLYLAGMQLGGLGSPSQALEAHWHIQVTMPWITLYRAAQVVANGTVNPTDAFNIGAFLLVVMVGLAAIKRLKPPHSLYLWITLGFILTRYYPKYQLQSLPRYALSLFPLFITLALLLDRPTPAGRAARIGYVVLGCMLQAVLLALFSAWRWVA
jgi:hypothetical protein